MQTISLARKATKAMVLPLGVPHPRRAGDVVILLYHRVGAGDREIDLDPAIFERQVSYLANEVPITTLDEAFQEGGAGGVAVTLDDGYADFHDHVLPVLVRYRVPALLYLATGLVANGAGSDGRLTWAQLREAASTGLVTIGAHTHSHADLSRATEKVAAEEMWRSKQLIEDRLGLVCRHFAYPWGVASSAAERAARSMFDTAALLWRTNRREAIERYRLGRTPVMRSDGLFFFRAKVNGVLDREALVYRMLGRGPWRR